MELINRQRALPGTMDFDENGLVFPDRNNRNTDLALSESGWTLEQYNY